MSDFLTILAESTLTMGAAIVLLLVLGPLLARRYATRWRYWVWLLVALRLLLPFSLSLPQAPVRLETPPDRVLYTAPPAEHEPLTSTDPAPDAAKTSGAALPDGADSMLDLSANADFWTNRKAVIQGTGLTVFRRGPWEPTTANGNLPRWELEFILPLEEAYSPLPLLADARQYFQDLFAAQGMWDSSDLPMYSFAHDIDYQDPTWPEAMASSAALYDSSTGRWLERIFLYDEEGNRLGVRSSLDYSLRFDGVRHRLGEEELGLFGTPTATNYTDAGDGTLFYSEWFGPNYNSGCDYLCQPETGTYSLVNLTTNRLDASTNTGIHVGSTVGEALDLYPDITLERTCLTLEESILGPGGCRLELYYSYGSDPEEPLEITRTRTITRICVSAPTWPGT